MFTPDNLLFVSDEILSFYQGNQTWAILSKTNNKIHNLFKYQRPKKLFHTWAVSFLFFVLEISSSTYIHTYITYKFLSLKKRKHNFIIIGRGPNWDVCHTQWKSKLPTVPRTFLSYISSAKKNRKFPQCVRAKKNIAKKGVSFFKKCCKN